MKNVVSDIFYYSISNHQVSNLREKGLFVERVSSVDLQFALSSGVTKIVIFNDTLPYEMGLCKRSGAEIELWQEGLTPFFGFQYNFRSFARNILRILPFGDRFVGYKPYFYNGCDRVVTAYPARVMKDAGVKAEIIHDAKIFSYLDSGEANAEYPIYAATDLFSSGLLKDHRAQIANFLRLLEDFPTLKFRPHPSEFHLADAWLPSKHLTFEHKYSDRVFGSISTLLHVNATRGAQVFLVVNGHTGLLRKMVEKNVAPFIDSEMVESILC